MRRARQQLQEAEAELRNVQQWSQRVEAAVAGYQRQARRLEGALEGDIPKATAFLEGKIDILQRYAAIGVPAFSAAPSSGFATAARTTGTIAGPSYPDRGYRDARGNDLTLRTSVSGDGRCRLRLYDPKLTPSLPPAGLISGAASQANLALERDASGLISSAR